ncbi:hypothetical protein BGX34_001129 [Mortierella sp. NVP85]|nr:hypothetical protein BGX34_001129 [Mortierella sp. NVP85]
MQATGTQFRVGNYGSMQPVSPGSLLDYALATLRAKTSFEVQLREQNGDLPAEQIIPNGKNLWAGLSAILDNLPSKDIVALFLYFVILERLGLSALSFSIRVIFNRPRVCSPSWSEMDLDEICWPQFALEDDIPFQDFLQNFEEIFQSEHIDPSNKFACFRRCLTRVNPSIIQKSRALNVRDYDVAVTRLRPHLSIPEDQRLARIEAQYTTIQQSKGQSLQSYYDEFTKLNSTHFLSENQSVKLFFNHLSTPLKEHIDSSFRPFAADKNISVSEFYKRVKLYLEIVPLAPTPPTPPATLTLPSRPKPVCSHCDKNHPSDRCYKVFPHLRPLSYNSKAPIRVNTLYHQNLPTSSIDYKETKADVLKDAGPASSCISPSFGSKASLEKR